MQIPEHIFKAYDIRGLVENELSEHLAYKVARSFVKLLEDRGIDLNGKYLIVGYDMRPTSIPFAQQIEQAFFDAGAKVRNIGLTSTPVFNFAVAHFDEHVGGIMVTASHNPAQYNGFKLTQGNGLPIGKNSGMSEIQQSVFEENFEQQGVLGESEVFDAITPYVERIFGLVDVDAIKPLRIVIDGGNGMGGAILPKWIDKLPIEVEYLYIEPDGTFPNHEANPLKTETLADLQKKVLEGDADFGFALDGDADRIGLVDEKGSIVSASAVGALLGARVLEDNPGSHMLYDLRSSAMIAELWESHGATTQKCMVGHALIKAMMKEVHAHFASELSLHVYFGSMYNMESTDLCLLYFLEMISKSGKTLSELMEPLEMYAHSGEINFEVEDKDGAIKRLETKYRSEALEESDLDGLWLRLEWGWLSVRKSNTEPVLRLNLETHDANLTQEKIQEVTEIIQQG